MENKLSVSLKIFPNPSTNYWAHISEVIQKEIDGKKWVKVEVAEVDLPWSPTSGSVTPYIAETAPI